MRMRMTLEGSKWNERLNLEVNDTTKVFHVMVL